VKVLFEPKEPTTYDRLGDTEPACRWQNASGICNFHECPQLLDVHLSVPR
jgi:hypothetical protein